MPLFAIAIPVAHSSGLWIAYAGSGYLGGTISSTWTGAFILGNSAWLASTGLISAASVAGAAGVISGLGASAAAATGVLLTNLGLGSVAAWLGIAPAATFLGLTAINWAIGSAVLAVVTLLGSVFARRKMKKINEERSKGGLDPISIRGIFKSVRDFENSAMKEILSRLERENDEVTLDEAQDRVSIKGVWYRISRLRYVVNPDGSEEICFVTRLWWKVRVFIVRAAGVGASAATS